jgi:hypothetical protein
MTNQDVVDCVWKASIEAHKAKLSIHKMCGLAVSAVLNKAMEKGSMDNVSAILVLLPHFETALHQKCSLAH